MPSGVANALPIVLVLFFVYLAVVRPSRRRAQEASRLQSALSIGDDVMLTSGFFGHVESIADEVVSIEISPGVVVRVHRGAVSKIVHDEPHSEPDGDVDSSTALGDESAGLPPAGGAGSSASGSHPNRAEPVVGNATPDDNTDPRGDVA